MYCTSRAILRFLHDNPSKWRQIGRTDRAISSDWKRILQLLRHSVRAASGRQSTFSGKYTELHTISVLRLRSSWDLRSVHFHSHRILPKHGMASSKQRTTEKSASKSNNLTKAITNFKAVKTVFTWTFSPQMWVSVLFPLSLLARFCDFWKSSRIQVSPQQSKAVMVFMHGGAFLTGSGSRDVYSPDYLINYDIVLVTLNYRLHVFGMARIP